MSRHHRKIAGRRWEVFRHRIFARDGFRCQAVLPDGSRCLRPSRLACHHPTPLEAGGAPFDPDNAVTYCRPCHIRHHQAERLRKLPPEVREWRAFMRERLANP